MHGVRAFSSLSPPPSSQTRPDNLIIPFSQKEYKWQQQNRHMLIYTEATYILTSISLLGVRNLCVSFANSHLNTTSPISTHSMEKSYVSNMELIHLQNYDELCIC